MKNMSRNKKTWIITCIGVIFAIFFIMISLVNYQKLLDAFIEKEQQHLMTITDSTAKGIETFFLEEERSLKLLVNDTSFIDYFVNLQKDEFQETTTPLELYFSLGSPRFTKLRIIDKEGILLDSYPKIKENKGPLEIDGLDISEILLQQKGDISEVVFRGKNGIMFMSYPIVTDDEFAGFIITEISVRYIYEYYVQRIETGNKGYASVKSSEGTFIMHPKVSQLGKSALQLRKEEFPEYDWSELEELFQRQMSGGRGTEMYHSVWVTDDEPEFILKFNGFAPAKVGDHFWIVTLSSDYEEAVKGIKKNYSYTLLTVSIIIISIIFALFNLFLMRQKYKELEINEEHLEEVKKLNQELEEDIKQRKLLELELIDKMEENKKKEVLMLHQSRYVAMGEMIGNIAHQWRQPLNTMSLIIANLEDFIREEDTDKELALSLLEKGKLLLQNMSGTIEDFRSFIKPKVKNCDFFVFKYIDKTLELCEERLNIEGVQIKVSGNPHIQLHGQASQLVQVLVNLINNSVDAFIENDINDRKIIIGFEKLENNCHIELKDNGGGIDSAIMDRIFEPYFTTKEGKNGTGLGMYMSKTIIEKYFDGNMSISNKGEGLNVLIVIPMIEGGTDYE